MKLLNKIAVVTGASSGMGHSIALEYAKQGATVVAIARRKEKLDALAKDAENEAGKIIAYQGDLSKQEVAEAIIEYTVKEFGRIDILVNNAGICDDLMPIAELDDELWNKVMVLDLNSPFWSSRKAVQYMLKQGKGNIINIASVGGLNGGRGGVAYITAKHGLVGLTKSTGYMYATKGIRCNVICPGCVTTEINTKFENTSPFGSERMYLGLNTSSHPADPIEIANVAVFLASDDSSFINGASIVADGGWTAY